MRKINLLIGSGALVLGMLIGMTVFAVAASPTSPTTILAKFQGSVAAPAQQGTEGTTEAPLVDDGSLQESLDTDGTLRKEIPSAITNDSDASSGQDSAEQVSAQLAEQIIADYKQDLGIFFDAWQAEDMTEFRSRLAKAYAGELFEKHARRAEPYLVQGIGLEVSDISFDQITIDSASNSAATLRADYRYTAQDYSLALGVVVGEPREHSVHVRANLIKMNGRWVVTGETVL